MTMSRTAIVTGGGSGIGAALAEELVRAGYDVVLADIDENAAIEVASSLNAPSGARESSGKAAERGIAQGAELDVRDADAVQQLVDRVVKDHGRLDLMVNNAGIGVGGNSLDLDIAHWDRVIDVNLRGVIHGTHAALKPMSEQGSGHIVNVASLAGLVPSPFTAPYTATKHAVVGMTMSLRLEFADTGVEFTVVCPGFTDTPILDKAGPDDLPQVIAPGSVREGAQNSPIGVYEVALLAEDIIAGINSNAAMVVTPRSARTAWRAWRTSPKGFMELTRRAMGKKDQGPVASSS